MTGPEVFEAPVVDASSRPYYEAAAQGRMLGKRCRSCGRLHWYPRRLCPFCLGETEWLPLAGTGEIYAVTVSYRGRPAPFALAYVRLDEGITVLTNILSDSPEALRIGDRVRVEFAPTTADTLIPVFRPVEEKSRVEEEI